MLLGRSRRIFRFYLSNGANIQQVDKSRSANNVIANRITYTYPRKLRSLSLLVEIVLLIVDKVM